MKRLVSVKAISYAKLQRRYGGQFIARQEGKVLANGVTYRELLRVIRRRQLNRQALIIGYVSPKDAVCIYAG